MSVFTANYVTTMSTLGRAALSDCAKCQTLRECENQSNAHSCLCPEHMVATPVRSVRAESTARRIAAVIVIALALMASIFVNH